MATVRTTRVRWAMLLAAALAAFCGGERPLRAQEMGAGDAQWIWAADTASDNVPAGAVYFRKAFHAANAESAQVEITADDRYQLFVNGRLVGSGDTWKKLDVYDIQSYLLRGRNVIAVRAENTEVGSAGLVALVTVKNRGNTDVSYSTDRSWKSSTAEQRGWAHPNFDDERWQPSAALGELGQAQPWGNQVANSGSGGRFRIASEFRVERVIQPDASGSLVAMAFNELGQIIASREGGPLVVIRDDDQDGLLETVSVYCELMKNCQGILPLNGLVFAVGDGPEKTGFYRLSDEDRDGKAEKADLLFKFEKGMGEHGPHAPVLGPDGLIYLMIGNHSRATPEYEKTSPLANYYEGDLVQPRYEDAGGHAHGIKAPGGTVVRTDIEGSFVELFCGGFRNAYDMAFNKQGDLFTYDSDMEWDVGLPFYRPTRINHCVPAGEYGWRSGWANWPDYFLDSLPTTIDIGRGSPTGVEFYNHYMFPVRYQNALFGADWSMGRIVAVRLQPAENGSYVARSEVFLQGRPLNVSDLAVGPDGWLYFSTGGRGTEGGIYRIRWLGKVPPRPKLTGVMQAVRQPQLQSAWGRNRVANLKVKLGPQWNEQLTALVQNARASDDDRVRGLELMQLMGPFPTPDLLVGVSQSESADVRAKATYLMGVNANEATAERLVELLDDPDARVRRLACESLLRSDQMPPAETMVRLLRDPARWVRWAARRSLEHVPREQWQASVLASEDPRLFVEGATALLALGPDRVTTTAVLSRASELMRSFVPDDEFIDLLRVIQLAIAQGKLTPEDVPDLKVQLAEEYPALEWRMNRELVRLLAYLREGSIVSRLLEQLENEEVALPDKIHASFYARFLDEGWNLSQKLDLLSFYETTRQLPGGHSYKGYFDNVCRDFVGQMEKDELLVVLDRATQMPNAALMALYKLPEKPPAELLTKLIQIDRELKGVDSEDARRLGTGIVAVLGTSRAPEAMAYLREAFDRDPDRREELAMGLAQDPSGDNWPLLVRALPIVEGAAAQEVLSKLAAVDQAPDQPEPLRQLILCGLKLKGEGAKHSLTLLEKWTGQQPAEENASWDKALAAWQTWFASTYPDQPSPQLPTAAAGSKWTSSQLLEFLDSTAGHAGNPARGEQVFAKALCIKCHRYGSRGEGQGPDLTTVSQRFQRKEILESVLFPSQVVSDQYASKTVITKDGLTHTGLVDASREDSVVVLEANAQKSVIPRDEVDEIVPAPKSAMPEGLFDELTLEEIADLFALLAKPPIGR